jgi:hypothetical protein
VKKSSKPIIDQKNYKKLSRAGTKKIPKLVQTYFQSKLKKKNFFLGLGKSQD